MKLIEERERVGAMVLEARGSRRRSGDARGRSSEVVAGDGGQRSGRSGGKGGQFLL